MSSFQFHKVVPVLSVASMQTAMDFYTFTLGFIVLWRTPGDGGENCKLQSGPVEVILSTELRQNEDERRGGTLHFDTAGISFVYEQLLGQVQVARPLGITTYGKREFAIRDPDGHLLIFSEEASSASAGDTVHPYDGFLVESLARNGPNRKIQMIKELREHAGIGLKDSKDAVEDFLRRRDPGTYRVSAIWPTVAPSDIDTFLSQRISAEQQAGRTSNKILLIKDVRERQNIGLAQAKDIVDAYYQRHNLNPPAEPGLLGRLFGRH